MHFHSTHKILCLLFIASAAILGAYKYLDTLWGNPVAQDKTLGSQPQEDLALFQRTVRKRRELMLCQCEKIASSMKVGRFDGVKTQLKHGGNRELGDLWDPLISVSATRATHLLAFPREDILWCPVFKAATSSWYRNLLRLSHLPQKAQGDRIKIQMKHGGNGVLVEPLIKRFKSASAIQACSVNVNC